MELSHLRTIRAQLAAAEFVLHCLECPALQELDLRLGSEMEDKLFMFLLRSMPQLQVLHLDFYLPNPSRISNPVPFLTEHILEALALVPSVVKFKVRWSRWDDVDVLLQALTPKGPFALLPALQILEFDNVRAQPAPIINLISAQWNSRTDSCLREV